MEKQGPKGKVSRRYETTEEEDEELGMDDFEVHRGRPR